MNIELGRLRTSVEVGREEHLSVRHHCIISFLSWPCALLCDVSLDCGHWFILHVPVHSWLPF